MKREHHRDIDRQPGRVEKGKQPVTGEKLPQARQVVERLRRGIHAATFQSPFETGLIDLATQQHIQPGTDPNHDPRTDPFQGGKRDQQPGHDQG
ncbi:hypothetical protein D9M70_651110 [compost metagenome]